RSRPGAAAGGDLQRVCRSAINWRQCSPAHNILRVEGPFSPSPWGSAVGLYGLPDGGQHFPALVLNADFRPLSYFPLSLWSWQDAVKSVFLDRVSVLSEY